MFTAERVIHMRLKKSMIKCRNNKVERIIQHRSVITKKTSFLSRFDGVLSDVKNRFIPLLYWNASCHVSSGPCKCIL